MELRHDDLERLGALGHYRRDRFLRLHMVAAGLGFALFASVDHEDGIQQKRPEVLI